MMDWLRNSFACVLVLLLLTSGCATGRTMMHFSDETPIVYSGTRLDVNALSGDTHILQVYREKYGLEPPAHPRLDLPFSFLLDTLLLVPVVLPLALYSAVFD